jgi:hypothetical protein
VTAHLVLIRATRFLGPSIRQRQEVQPAKVRNP